MGYKVSQDSIDKVDYILNTLLEYKDSTLEITTMYPNKLAYIIREALNSVKALGHPKYISLIGVYKITILEDKLIFTRQLEKEKISLTKDLTDLDELDLIDYVTGNNLSIGIEYKVKKDLGHLVDWIKGLHKITVQEDDYYLYIKLWGDDE